MSFAPIVIHMLRGKSWKEKIFTLVGLMVSCLILAGLYQLGVWVLSFFVEPSNG